MSNPPPTAPTPLGTSHIGTTPRKQTEVALALIFNDAGQLLICKRKPDAVLANFWEFPGGKCHAEESPADCARRETREETNLTVEILKPLALVEHHYPHADVRLHPFLCRYVSGELQLLAVADARWIAPQEVTQFPFPEANALLLQKVAQGFDTLLKLTDIPV